MVAAQDIGAELFLVPGRQLRRGDAASPTPASRWPRSPTLDDALKALVGLRGRPHARRLLTACGAATVAAGRRCGKLGSTGEPGAARCVVQVDRGRRVAGPAARHLDRLQLKETARGHAAPRAGADAVAARQAGPRRRRRAAGAVHRDRDADQRLRRLPLVRRDRATPRSSGPSCRPARCCSPSPGSPPAGWSPPRSTSPTGSGRRSGRCRWSSRTSSATASRWSRAAAWCSPRSPSCSGLFAGFTAQGSWQTWLTFRNSTDFGRTDPQFGIDLSFFVFDYPFYRLVLGFALRHRAAGADRLAADALRLRRAAAADAGAEADGGRAGAAVGAARPVRGAQGGRLLAGPLRAGLLRPRRRLHRRQLHRRQRAAGAQDDPGVRRGRLRGRVLRQHLRPQLPAAGRRAGAAAGLQPGHRRGLPGDRAAVRGQAQRRREGGALHRAGHRVDARRPTGSPTSSTSTTRRAPPATRSTPRRARPSCATTPRPSRTPGCSTRTSSPTTFTARQQIRNVYGFPEKLDIDRYTIDGGRPRDYVVAVRELNSAGLSENQDTWINRHTVYTHGNGFVAAPANEVVAGQEGGEPNFTTGDLPTSGNIDVEAAADLLRRADPAGRPGRYSVVGAPDGRRRRASSTSPRTAPTRGRSTTPTTARAASSIGSFFRQLTFAIYYRERNFLLSGAVNDDSKVLYVRDPRDRVEKVAPFLKVDGDPYPAVIDGRVTWILDGYTTSDAYPYSERCELGEAAADSLTGAGTTALPNEQFNYIRNSVKATVDAYDGTVTLYAVGREGPGPADLHEGLPGHRASRRATMSDELRQPRPLPGGPVQGAAGHPHPLPRRRPGRTSTTRTTAGRCPTTRRRTPSDAQPPYYILAQRPGDDAATGGGRRRRPAGARLHPPPPRRRTHAVGRRALPPALDEAVADINGALVALQLRSRAATSRARDGAGRPAEGGRRVSGRAGRRRDGTPTG